MGKAPRSVIVVSILCIIFSVFGLLGGPCGIVQVFHPFMSDPTAEKLRQDPTITQMALFGGTVRFCLGALLLICGIGALKLKRWGRAGLNTYAVIYMLETIVMTVLQFVYVMPKTLEAMKGVPDVTDAMIRAAGTVYLITGVVFGVCAVGISLTILITFNRKVAVDAFNGIFPAEGTGLSMDDQPRGGVV